MFAHIIVTYAMHAFLHTRFSFSAHGHVKIGNSHNDYGPVDRDTGAQYICIGWPNRERGKEHLVTHSSDLSPGHFYNEAIIITGRDENDKTLTHEQIESFKNFLRATPGGRVILPRGYDGGQMTWDNGWKYYPDLAPNWYEMEETLKRKLKYPEIEIYRPPGCSYIEIFLPDVAFEPKFTLLQGELQL